MSFIMSVLVLIVLLSPVAWGLYKLLKHLYLHLSGKTVVSVSSSTAYCRSCGASGHPVRVLQGKLGTELLLWLLGILPGVIYSFWRDNANFSCSKCGGRVLGDL